MKAKLRAMMLEEKTSCNNIDIDMNYVERNNFVQ